MKYYISRKKIDSISKGVLLICIGLLLYTGAWWPGIIFAIGLWVAVRQYLSGRKYDLMLTLMLCGGCAIFTLSFIILMPLFLIGSGVYLIGREYFLSDRIHLERKNSEWS